MRKFQIKGRWRKEDYGQVYTAEALTPAGRILAVVNIEVPLAVEFDMRERFGDAYVDQVEKSAKQQAERAALGWEKRQKKVAS